MPPKFTACKTAFVCFGTSCVNAVVLPALLICVSFLLLFVLLYSSVAMILE